MHVETLSYLFERLEPGLRESKPPSLDQRPAPAQRWLAVPAGPVELGLHRATAPAAGWCNEYEGFTTRVPAFAIEERKTTTGDWLEFLEAGGYRERDLWTDADWAWRVKEGVTAPAGWTLRDRGWTLRTCDVDVPLPRSWPVYVSHAEATAYARFRGARLPTEAEWHRAVHGTAAGQTRPFPWGDEAPVPGLHGNFGFAHRHPTTVGAHPAGRSAFGLDEPVGNGWEWTASPFAPFPGFERYAVYPGYSEPFFDGRHFVIAGASAVTALPLLRRSFRNWYQPHYRAPFATLRLAREAA
jgi:formylglycine-generating enzyme required for sulfatase activity